MKRILILVPLIVILVMVFFFATAAAMRTNGMGSITQDNAPSDTYSLDWWTVDSGGGSSNGGNYTLSGTIGQHDASDPMTGGDYGLQGGFWGVKGVGAAAPQNKKIYLPVIVK